MNEQRREIIIPKKNAEYLKKLLHTVPQSESDCFGEDETISHTAVFENGIEMDIKVCGVQYEEDEENLPWTEAVLFDHGSEVCCSEPAEEFFGSWELEYNGTKYITDMKEGE